MSRQSDRFSGNAVAAEGKGIFEKPRDKQQAAELLTEYSGSPFQFITAIAVLNTTTRRAVDT